MKKNITLFLFGLFSSLVLSAQITPWIESVTPAQNAIAVAANTNIEIAFSENISGELLQESISIYGSHSGFHNFSATVNATNTHIFIETDDDFKPGETVFWTLNTNIENLNGDKMPVPMTASFYIKPESLTENFQVQTPISTDDTPYSLTTSDFDGDGFLDLATANRGANTVNILINNRSGNFTNMTSINVGILPESIVSGDFDKDGDADIAVINSSNHNISILKNNGDASFTAAENVSVGLSPHGINMGDIDGDGDLDLITSNFSEATLSIVTNDGESNFEEIFTVDVGNLPEYAIVKDLDNDGDLDLASPSFTTGSIFIVENIGDGEFENNATISVGNNPHIPLSGDLNGDGFEDIIVPNTASNSLSILTNTNGDFLNSANISQSGSPYAGTTFDMDGDGDLDVAIPLYQNSKIQLFENDGSGNLTNIGDFMVKNRPHVVVSGDFNNDGTVDLAVCNDGDNSVSVLLNNAIETKTNNVISKSIEHTSFPNPFQNKVIISYELEQKSMLKVEIYDALGQQVATLFEGRQIAGKHHLTWDGSNLESGMYVYKIVGAHFETSGKLSLF